MHLEAALQRNPVKPMRDLEQIRDQGFKGRASRFQRVHVARDLLTVVHSVLSKVLQPGVKAETGAGGKPVPVEAGGLL